METSTFNFVKNKKNIFGRIWQPKHPKSVLILVHGMGEHSNRYKDSIVPYFIKNNFVIIAFDQFGHGLSQGKRGYCPNYDALLNLIEFSIQKATNLFTNLPIYLYGHSLGGNLVINYTLKRKHSLKGVIATSPFLRLAFQPPKWKMIIGKLLLNILPSMVMSSELDANAISRNKKEVKKYINDKLVHDKVTPMYTFPIIENGKWAILNAHKLKTNMLVLHGTGDKIIDHKASKEFCDNSKKATLKLFKNGYHELHHDTCKGEFIESVLTWLNKN